VLQVIGKDGLIYGLGVGKTRWRYETRMQTKADAVDSFDPALFVEGAAGQGRARSMTRWPSASTRSTFLWDPLADSMDRRPSG
jgi:hypothetical protein